MRLPKNWKNLTEFSFLVIFFFIVGCSVNTTNVRPSFDDNYENKFGKEGTNVRPSKRGAPSQNDNQKTAQNSSEQQQKISQEEAKKNEETPAKISLRGSGNYKRAADKYFGAPYYSGGTTRRGFDCSGFIWRVYQDVGHTNFQRTTAQAMYDKGKPVSQAALREGDLVFFHHPKNRKQINHAGIYISDGEFIHAASTLGVAYSKLTDVYWKDLFVGFRRVLP